MKKIIHVNGDKSCSPNDIVIGYVGEKNVDSIIIQLDESLPEMKYFLLVGNKIYPFIDNELKINEILTSEKGVLKVSIVGSNAKSNQPITSGSLFFHSDNIILRVREN